ncbi:hypothetical protein MJO28_007028 [Puccinia striiformis f. sp. tritici]|uniref:Uncharacterized protein n=1 Tax=Puccinia striiformis f. sp. tritici TaxID=168172 RepID=A0ACC0EEZ7_9BASI|nr:hypothetical protein MJO28_007028 [Puccinia striiformis f. sp. tritici]
MQLRPELSAVQIIHAKVWSPHPAGGELGRLSGRNTRLSAFGFNDEEDMNTLLERGRIFFNHFVLIQYTPQANNLLEWLYRAMAFQCNPNQPGLDQLFTIYLVPLSTPKANSKAKANATSSLDLENHIPLDVKYITFCGVTTQSVRHDVT